MFPCSAMLCQCCHRIIIRKEKRSVYKYFMSKSKSFIRWKENEGAVGCHTGRPFVHDPVRNFPKVPSAWFSPPGSNCQAASRCRRNGTVSCRPAG
ncbi:hypothetical protein E1J06_05170 [Phocaeicola dorei]|uniref:Uncharacterized protein n=1 Tax=Phocaeicola dorei TaxID=357276 RepID=A0AAX2R253_9BACT|nr:hypothetical protein E1J06_05170 [Phocaeicola dorei]TDB14288.1 hypothetical protein E1I95_05030 [Phocaeicola dorei]TDB20609.1 hypothetical protein E1I71_06750 [Phocaeicola dorei]